MSYFFQQYSKKAKAPEKRARPPSKCLFQTPVGDGYRNGAMRRTRYERGGKLFLRFYGEKCLRYGFIGENAYRFGERYGRTQFAPTLEVRIGGDGDKGEQHSPLSIAYIG